jgi:hypothetical protein
MKHAGLATPWSLAGGDPAYQQETDGQRRSLIYGHYDWKSKIFGFIPVGGKDFLGATGGGRPQCQLWERDSWGAEHGMQDGMGMCKVTGMRLSRIEEYETYNADFRRWHWRLGMEQLFFSHQNINPATGKPWYMSNTKRMLLMCGMEDLGNGLCESTRQVAPHMQYTPGHALFLNTTGHSIHSERPNFMARHLADFIEPEQIGLEIDANRQGGDYRSFPMPAANPIACRDACVREHQCRAFTYVRPPSEGASATCWLKSAQGTKSMNVDCVSGVVR